MFNTKVTRKSYGIKGTNPDRLNSSMISGRARYRDKKEIALESAASEQVSIDIKNANAKHSHERTVLSKVTESQIQSATSRLYRQGKEMVFIELLSETYLHALNLDEEFVLEQDANLRNTVATYVKDNGGYTLLENAIKQTGSSYLKRMKVLCEATAKKVTDRKNANMRAGAEDVNGVDFSFNDSEREEFDYDKGINGVDQVGQRVKEKVLNTVIEEKERQRKEEEFENDVMKATNEVKDDSIEVDETPIKESQNVFKSIYEGDTSEDNDIEDETPVKSRKSATVIELKKGLRESTLFNSIMMSTLNESVAARVASLAINDETTDDEGVYTHPDDVRKNVYGGDQTAREEQNTHPLSKEKIDMDLILAESVAQYTLLEMVHTLQLKPFNHEIVRNMSRNMLK